MRQPPIMHCQEQPNTYPRPATSISYTQAGGFAPPGQNSIPPGFLSEQNVGMLQQNTLHPPVGSTQHVSRARIPPPQLDRDYLQLSFVRLESWFENYNVWSDQTKFTTLVALLEHRQMTHVLGTVLNPPETNKYQTLKQAMLDNIGDSTQQRYRKLINAGELGDHKPSYRLNELRRLANGEMNDNLLKQIWLAQLPSEVRAVLAICQDYDLNILAKKADDVSESLTPKHVASVSLEATPEIQEPAYINELRIAIEQIQRELKSSRSRPSSPPNDKRRNRSSSRGPFRSSSRQRSESPESSQTCWHHRTFGDKARKCKKPCDRANDFDSKN